METLKTRIGTTTTFNISFKNLPSGCSPAAAILANVEEIQTTDFRLYHSKYNG